MDTTFYHDLRGLQTAFDNTDDLSAKVYLARLMRKLTQEHNEKLKAQYSTITSKKLAA